MIPPKFPISNTTFSHDPLDVGSIGLVLNAISGQTLQLQQNDAHMAIVVYADVTEVRSLKPPKLPPPTAKRGIIKKFSRKSRKRMIRRVAKIRNLNSSIFITLTYPGEFVFTPRQVKAHFFAFKRRIFRKFKNTGMIWRLELKTRKTGASVGQIAPHFHVVLIHQNFISVRDLIGFTRWAWNEIVAPNDEKHFLAGTSVEVLKNRAQAMGYISKTLGYVQKADELNEDQIEQGWGRYWGICGNVDVRPIAVITVDYEQFVEIRRYIAKSMKSRERQRVKINKKMGRSTKQRKYYKKVKKGGKQRGFAILGYGDLSQNNKIFQKSAIWRLITVTSRMLFSVTG